MLSQGQSLLNLIKKTQVSRVRRRDAFPTVCPLRQKRNITTQHLMKTGVLEMDIVMSLMIIPAGHLDGWMDGQRRLANRPNEQRGEKKSAAINL